MANPENPNLPRVTFARLEFGLKSRDRKQIQALKNSILPETGNVGRCIVKLEEKQSTKSNGFPTSSEETLLLTFEAKDLVSLRASFNTNLRLISSAIRTIESLSRNEVPVKESKLWRVSRKESKSETERLNKLDSLPSIN